MGTKFRTLTLVVGLALAAGTAMAGPLGAATPPIVGSGTVSCSVKATLSFAPPLKYPGTTQPTVITLKSTLSGCTGTGDGANIKSGKTVVVHTVEDNDCLNRLEGTPTDQSGDIKWSVLAHTPKQANSTITFTAATKNDGPPISIDSTGSATAGSYNGDAAAAHSQVSDKETAAALTQKCLTSGLKTIHLVSPGSTFVLSSPPS